MGAMKALFGLLALGAVHDMGAAIGETMLQAHLAGRLSVSDHHELALADPFKVDVSFEGLPFQEAVDFYRRKQPMTNEEFAELEDRYKAKGATVAGVSSRYVVEEAHTALADAIAEGKTDRDWLGVVNDAFASAGVEQPGDYHLLTTFDTSVLGSYAAGRYEQLTHPSVLATRPYWEYDTVGDSRVRATHRAMNGKVFPADSAIWQTWFPPNGYNCRCSVKSISREEVEARGIEVQEDVPSKVHLEDGTPVALLPDPGFNGSPATQRAADETVAKVRAQAHRQGALTDAPADLERKDDARRRAVVDRFAGLEPGQVEDAVRDTWTFNVSPATPAPAPGELHVDWHMYSQNLDTAEQLVTRLVQEDGLYRLKDRISVAARATYMGDWDAARWPDPEVVHDPELARRLGLAPNLTSARSTEYAIRLRARPGELEQLLGFLHENGERGAGRAPARRAWDVQDIRVRAGEGVELPESERFKRAVHNERQLEGGRRQVTLSKEPLEGWSHSSVLVNRSLWDFLP